MSAHVRVRRATRRQLERSSDRGDLNTPCSVSRGVLLDSLIIGQASTMLDDHGARPTRTEGSLVDRSPPPAIDVGSRSIRDVEPMRPPSDGWSTGSNWSCTRCLRTFPVSESQAVVFDSNGRDLRFVVCTDCADRYRVPTPVALDLTRMPPPDRAERDLRAIAAHAWFVSNIRTSPPVGVVTLRDADVRQIAHQNRETPADLTRRLTERGLLTTAT